jgi:hypothetical protein
MGGSNENPKLQTPSSKEATNSNTQMPRAQFGIWDLELFLNPYDNPQLHEID